MKRPTPNPAPLIISGKLEYGFRMISAGSPLPQGHEDIDVPVFWLLLYPKPYLTLHPKPEAVKQSRLSGSKATTAIIAAKYIFVLTICTASDLPPASRGFDDDDDDDDDDDCSCFFFFFYCYSSYYLFSLVMLLL